MRILTDLGDAPEISGYSIGNTLGGGRWSRVYQATQASLDRPVAIKVLTNSSEEFTARFNREANIMASLSHPNLVSVIDRGQVDGLSYIAMEYLDQGSLRDLLKPGEPLDTLMIHRVLSAMSSALTSLHSRDLIHRDVKPDNILLGSAGQVKLCDFGIAVLLAEIGHLTTEDASPGTLDYMAPEQRYRLDVSQKADQYALGVVAYEMLTGSLPPRMFRKPSERNSNLNEEVDSVLEQVLQEEPSKRFESVSEFVEALLSALGIEDPESVQPPRDFRDYIIPGILTVASALIVITSLTQPGGNQNQLVAESGPENSSVDQPTNQTGALPYRIAADGTVEVMIVRARSGNHWTIPKANQKEGVSLEEVAEEEAFEEAGLHGRAIPAVIGKYGYIRKGKSYLVQVVPVEASQELQNWPEDFRDRLWCTTSEAEELIASDGLRLIVDGFSPSAALAAAEGNKKR